MTVSEHAAPDPQAPDRTTVWVDVTNTLAVAYVTGLQRLTRELLTRLPGPDSTEPVRFVPVRWCEECDGFKRLDAAERDRLENFRSPTDPERSRLAKLGDPLPERAKTAARVVVHSPPVRSLRDEIARRRRSRDHPASHAEQLISSWPANSYFLDLEAAWHNTPTRDILLPRLRREGVTTATLVADVIPEMFPEWFDANQIELFDRFIRAHLQHSEMFPCISTCSERDLIAFARKVGITRPLDTSVVAMGANFTRAADDLARPAEAPPGRYILSVGTVEPRKNHGLLIDAFERLCGTYHDLSLVFVGKSGWMTAEVIERMRSHPELGARFVWPENVSDDLLDAFYRHAYLSVQPSFYEGFGAPVVEALGNGVPTLASTGGALPEAGGEWAEYFDPHDVDALIALIDRHYGDPAHHEEMRKRLVDYRPPTWEDGAADLLAAFAGRHPGPRNT